MSSKPGPPSKEEILLAFGRAVYLAQAMEIGMRIFYWLDKSLPDAPPGKPPRVDFNADPLPEYNVYSLGGFIRQFRKELMAEGTVDTHTRSIMRKLEHAVEERNRLIHNYWGQRGLLMGQQGGREAILADLIQMIGSFQYHHLLIRHMVLLLLSQYNLAPEAIEAETFQAYLLMEDSFGSSS
jgi:hypothetical protein